MSLEILTGVPGAGKTFYAVHRILKLLKDEERKLLILHNIEGLNPGDYRCLSVDWQTSDFHAQFMADRLRQLRTDYGLSAEDPIYLFIDEAQRFVPPELKDSQILYFFDYHRHFGVDIVLITQHEKKLTYKITTLADAEIRAVSARINPLGSFIYKLSSGGEQYSSERLSKDPHVFSAYKSFQAGTGKAKKSRFRYVVLAIVVAAPLMWLFFFRVFAESFGLVPSEVSDAPPSVASQAVAAPLPPERVSLSASRVTSVPNSPMSKSDEPAPTIYSGPVIDDYDSLRDMLLMSDEKKGFSGYVTVKKFIEDYPPQLYGYGYFHAPRRRFVMMSASNQELIFPVKNPVFVRSFIRSVPAPAPVSAPAAAPVRPPYPLDYLDKSEAPDTSGYRRSDYERIFMHQRGFRYETNSTAVPPTSPGDARQPGAQAGAAPPPKEQSTPSSNRG